MGYEPFKKTRKSAIDALPDSICGRIRVTSDMGDGSITFDFDPQHSVAATCRRSYRTLESASVNNAPSEFHPFSWHYFRYYESNGTPRQSTRFGDTKRHS